MPPSSASRPTLQDVADAAGVSRMTASRALRNHPEVAPATAARLQQVARSLGYSPNPLISVLMQNICRGGSSGVSTNVAFLHAGPTKNHWRSLVHYRELVAGVKARAGELGYGVEMVWIEDPTLQPHALVRLLHARGVKGLIIGPVFHPELNFDFSDFAVVALGLSLKTPLFHRVATNQNAAVRIALENLRASGCRRLGFVLNQHPDDRYDHQWLGAAWAEFYRTPEENRVPPLILDERPDEELLAPWLDRHRPDGLLVTNRVVPGLVKTLVPKATPAMADLLWESGLSSISGVARDRLTIGAAGVDMVAAMLGRNERGKPAAAHLLLVDPQWKPAPGDSPRPPSTSRAPKTTVAR